MFIESITLDGLLSFEPGTPAFPLLPLNLLIGPNGSGKSNLIEAFELLRAVPTAFATAIRDGGGVQEWLWKGSPSATSARIEAVLNRPQSSKLRYGLEFAPSGARVEVTDERIEESEIHKPGADDVYFYYRYNDGHPTLNTKKSGERRLRREDLASDESVLSQRKDPELYPELTWCARNFARIQTFREWSFGRYAPLRLPQPADLPNEILLPDSRNLGLLINRLEHTDAGPRLTKILRQFLPRFERFSTLVSAGSIQVYFHEQGLGRTVPATRLSDGTLRFLAMAALLLQPDPPPLICIDEPELGLHPDAIAILAELFLEAQSRSQLVITTHSDALISALSGQVESVVVCEHRGSTTLRRLEYGRLESWLENYRLGDLWRIGELGGNP